MKDWVIGGIISWAGLAYYLELGSYFPNRGGAEVVYLEQAWRKPKYLLPASFAVSLEQWITLTDRRAPSSPLSVPRTVLFSLATFSLLQVSHLQAGSVSHS